MKYNNKFRKYIILFLVVFIFHALSAFAVTSPCTDSDGGANEFVAGRIKGSSYMLSGQPIVERTDYCDGSVQLVEFFCGSTGYINYPRLSCAAGYHCVNGACRPKCVDSDRGQNLYVKGTTTGVLETESRSITYLETEPIESSLFNLQSEFIDVCISANEVREYSCIIDIQNQYRQYFVRSSSFQCLPGYQCVDGACKLAVCTPNWQCTNFAACSEGVQTRTCTDQNNCGTIASKPAETQCCDACTEGQKQCAAGKSIQTCINGASGCKYWQTTACTEGQICVGGNCIAGCIENSDCTTEQECDLLSKQCKAKEPITNIKTLVATPELTDVQYKGYYGINTLPALYKPNKDSIQEQIETYISNNINKCTKFENFKGLQITYEQPNTTLYIANDSNKIITEESTYFTLNWPITIKETTTNTTTTLTDFATSIELPLAKIYYNITNILNREAQDINYEPKSEGNYLATKIKTGTDSIIFLKFINTRIDEQPYEFRFARHTRHPAIQLIKPLKKQLNLPNKPTFYDTIQLAKGAIIIINGKQLQFSNYKCSENDAVDLPWEQNSIDVVVSDPDDEPNNENIQLKFKSPSTETDTRVKFTESTPPDKNAIEVKIIAQKTDTLDTENKKEDSQTFWARVYECAPT